MIRITFLLFLAISFNTVVAQELDCSVKINNGQQIQNVDINVLEEMEDVLSSFMSDRNWTDDSFEKNERIKCNLIITIKDSPSIGNYRASVQILTARPAFKSTYETLLLNFGDEDWVFEFIQGQPINYTPNTYTDNLSSLLAFYAYVIIGLDYDSFSELGGTEFFNKAWDILNVSQSSNRPGWTQFGERRSRYWLIENLRNTQLEEIRKANYLIHRKGIDLFADQPDEGRKNILEAILKLQRVHGIKSNSPLMLTFFETKATELRDIFTEGDQKVRQQAYDALTKTDPSNADKYQKILN